MTDERKIFGKIDWTLVWIFAALVFTGWLNIYAAVYNEDHKSIFDISQNYGKQLIWIGTAFVIALFIMMLEPRFFSAFAFLTYGFLIVLLIAVLIIGKDISGSKSWFQIGGFALQPSEFAKFATNLALAKFLSDLNIKISDTRTKVIAFGIILLPVVFILLQNDTGSAIVFLSFIFVLYREGLSGNILLLGVFIIVLFFLALLIDKFVLIGILGGLTLIWFFFIKKNIRDILTLVLIFVAVAGFVYSVDYAFEHMLEPHHRERINVLLGKEVDLKGSGYNVNQSKIAIGSGGFFGKGYLNGTQTKFNFVPEQSTDFIFCTVGEEWGFAGSVVVIALFIGLLIRIIYVAERQRSAFSRIYGYGVASIFFFHFAVNIGMTLGLAPVVGIPLPFLSYGGSSLWAFTILLFIFIKMDSNRLNLL